MHQVGTGVCVTSDYESGGSNLFGRTS